MYRSVDRYLKSCTECQRHKTSTLAPAGYLQPIEPPGSPFERVGIDFLGPFPLSTSGNRWIIVAIDHLTRYAETASVPTATALQVATFLLSNIILRHGAPRVLLSDRGSPFLAQVVHNVLSLTRTLHSTTTAYHPQTNGLTERLNHTLAQMISMYVSADHTNWDLILPYVTYAYNTAQQSTTGYSPFYLLYGREATSLLDCLLPPTHDVTLDAFSSAAVSHAEYARQVAMCRTVDSQDDQCRRYNLRRRNISYNPGDLVWLWTPDRKVGRAEKFQPRYTGPYKVSRRLSDLTYELHPCTSAPARRSSSPMTVHVVRLKPYNPP